MLFASKSLVKHGRFAIFTKEESFEAENVGTILISFSFGKINANPSRQKEPNSKNEITKEAKHP